MDKAMFLFGVVIEIVVLVSALFFEQTPDEIQQITSIALLGITLMLFGIGRKVFSL